MHLVAGPRPKRPRVADYPSDLDNHGSGVDYDGGTLMGAMEPAILRRGKLFHHQVQADWAGYLEGATVRPEHVIRYGIVPAGAEHKRLGRIDVFVDRLSDFVSIVEIKATDWDRVKRPRKLLDAHCRQILKYVDECMRRDCCSVCAAILYPREPVTAGLKDLVEEDAGTQGLQVFWYRLSS
jgi:hypothetical protein